MKRYTGELANPIEAKLSPQTIHEHLTWDPKNQFGALGATIGAEIERKIPLLFEHFGIPRTGTELDYRLLAVALAATYVRGFQVVDPAKAKAGRKKRWTDERRTQLFADVEALKRVVLLPLGLLFLGKLLLWRRLLDDSPTWKLAPLLQILQVVWS